MATEADLNKSIDDLSAAIYRKNALIVELLERLEILVDRFGCLVKEDAFAYNDIEAARMTIAKVKKGAAA